MVGHHADEKAIHCMDQFNIDMRPHIAMSNNQKKHLEQTWSFAKGKVFRLGHWQNQNVPDPYQHDQAFFDETCRNIQKYVSDWQSHF